MPGHPKHQKRQLKVKARDWHDVKQTIAVEAQTEYDAIFRAGVATGHHPEPERR